jgi:hypothetical protein
VKGHTVTSPEDTMAQCKALFGVWALSLSTHLLTVSYHDISQHSYDVLYSPHSYSLPW